MFEFPELEKVVVVVEGFVEVVVIVEYLVVVIDGEEVEVFVSFILLEKKLLNKSNAELTFLGVVKNVIFSFSDFSDLLLPCFSRSIPKFLPVLTYLSFTSRFCLSVSCSFGHGFFAAPTNFQSPISYHFSNILSLLTFCL